MAIEAPVDWVQCGRTFGEKEIDQIHETAAWLPGLSRTEWATTICEHLNWHTASGTPKGEACDKLFGKMAAADLIKLPTRKAVCAHPVLRVKVIFGKRTRTGTLVTGHLRELEPVHPGLVTEREEIAL